MSRIVEALSSKREIYEDNSSSACERIFSYNSSFLSPGEQIKISHLAPATIEVQASEIVEGEVKVSIENGEGILLVKFRSNGEYMCEELSDSKSLDIGKEEWIGLRKKIGSRYVRAVHVRNPDEEEIEDFLSEY